MPVPQLWRCFSLILFPPKCASQNEEVVQWLEFPPSLRRARAQCIRITRIHYRPAPLVDFAALYFIALYSALKGALVCQNNPTIPSGRAYITAKISQSDGAAAVIKGGYFGKILVIIGGRLWIHKIHCCQPLSKLKRSNWCLELRHGSLVDETRRRESKWEK